MARPGGNDEKIVMALASVGACHDSRSRIDRSHFAKNDLGVLLIAEQPAAWRRDVTWSQCRGGDLIEQRLKDVMVRSIDERHVGIGVLEGASRVQSPETTTDNYDFWSRGH